MISALAAAIARVVRESATEQEMRDGMLLALNADAHGFAVDPAALVSEVCAELRRIIDSESDQARKGSLARAIEVICEESLRDPPA